MKQFYILLLSLFTFLCFKANAQTGPYYWQVKTITSLTGGDTYTQNSTPQNLVLKLENCAGGNVQPHNLTQYTLAWYYNTTDSNTNGTLISSSTRNTEANFSPSITFTPSTNVVGTLYYYAVISNPSKTTCGFTGTLVSQTQGVTVTAPLGINDFDTKIKFQIFPNPSSESIKVMGILQNEDYIIYNLLGSEVAKGVISDDEGINVKSLEKGIYFLKFENRKSLKFIKE